MEDELTDMDEVLGPKNDDAESSSSGGSSPRSSLSPEETTQYPVEADYVVSSASVQANSDHSSPADSPVLDHKETQQANGEEIKENGHDTAVVDKEEQEEEVHLKDKEEKEEQEEEVHSKAVTVPASQSPELVITVTKDDSNDQQISSSDDDSEGEEAPPTPSDTTSTSTEGERHLDSTSSEPTSPVTNGHENGLDTSPDLDMRRPTGMWYLQVSSFSSNYYFLFVYRY